MFVVLAFALFLAQGIPTLPNQTGTVTGILRAADGKPAFGVRVSAMSRPDNPADVVGGSSMAGIAETDEAGRFTLENIPPGRYYIVAGRLDLPTYYPGTQEMTAATIVRITPGANLSGVDFAMKDSSAGRVYASDFGFGGVIAAGITIPLRLILQDGARVPVFAQGRYTSPVLRLRSVAANSSNAYELRNPTIVAPQGEFNVTIENLPDGLGVQSIMYGASDLKTATLKVAGSSATPISVTLTTVTSRPNTVRVVGQMKAIEGRSIYMDGLSGMIYTDGTFEFRNVQPGRHAIVTPDHPAGAHPFAASVVVGDRNVEGVVLEEAAVLPPDIRDVVAPSSAGSRPVGSSLPLATVRGRVLGGPGQAVPASVTILGLLRDAYPVSADGRFEIPRLLPGSYTLEVSVPDRQPTTQSLVVGDDDLDVNLTIP